MTETRRIILNILATYGRSLYGVIIGLLCGRWALMALGEIDYGLWGLVGGLTAFISFFNNVLAGANARFYAFAVGAGKVMEDRINALEECRWWFNTALSVHIVVPLVLMIIGYPIGDFAIRHWLTIPVHRVAACIWVFRYACFSCFIAMVSVPFCAMYTAKQYIAELTIYSFVTSTINVIVLYYMVTHPNDWLTKYAACACVLSVAPQLIICMRACCVFDECRIRFSYMWNISRLKKLGNFAAWQFVGVFCGMLRTNGLSIVINKFFGASMNAAQAIGNTVQAQCFSLAGAMQGAFVPVITQACGAQDYNRMNAFVIRTCRFNVLLSLLFLIPLALELREVMAIWLKDPPVHAVGLCYCAMIYHLVGCCTVGHMVAVNAMGKIAGYHMTLGIISFFTLPIAILAGFITHDVYCIMGVVIFMEMLNSIGRVLFARRLCGTNLGMWIRDVIVPAALAIVVSLFAGWLPQLMLPASFARICLTTIVCEAFFLPFTWRVILSDEEKRFVKSKLTPRLRAISAIIR